MADYSPKYDAVTVEKYLTSIFGPPVKKHKTEARKIKRINLKFSKIVNWGQ